MEDKLFQNRDTSIQQILDRWPQTAPLLMHYKMLCIGCAVAPFHTLDEACAAHNLDEKKVRAHLTKFIARSRPGSAE